MSPTPNLCLCTAIVAGGSGGNKLGFVGRLFNCTLGAAPPLTLVAVVDIVPRVVARDVFPVIFVSVVAIEVILVLFEEGKGGRATGLIARGGARRVDVVVEGGFKGANADTESLEFKVGRGCGCDSVVGKADDICAGGVSLIGGGEMTFPEY
jgi:hypothetical protein